MAKTELKTKVNEASVTEFLIKGKAGAKATGG